MTDQERRGSNSRPTVEMKAALNEAQTHTLRTIEQFGWILRFVRQPLFLEPVPVVYSPQGKAFAVIENDGKLNTEIAILLRDE
jgi:hypothetical protein